MTGSRWHSAVFARFGGGVLLCLVMTETFAQGSFPLRYTPAPFDAAAVELDDHRRSEAGELELYARTLALQLNTAQHGTWSTEGADRIWRIAVGSPSAQAMELLLVDVDVPAGSSLHLLDEEGRRLAEPMMMALPEGVHECSSPMAYTDAMVVEFHQPLSAPFQGRFAIDGLAHAYRHVDDAMREGPCHVNVTCAPESLGWEDAIAATVRISVVTPQGNGWCSGTLMNNVRQDCTPYLLTANHCGRTSTAAQFNQYKFYFNFQYATCTGGSYSTSQFIQGAQRRGYSDDYTVELPLGGSDFMLLEANVPVPEAFEPFWAGWDANPVNNVSADGVCIHHPTGAPKRISSYTQTLTTGHPQTSTGLQSHYRVKWAATANGHGITESGSSGSGLFKPNAGLGPVLIGTLTGSSTGMTCTNNTGTSYFGKMSYHWTNNPNTTVQKLKHWLDPDDTGVLVLGGSADPCGAASSVNEMADQALQVYPNPATERLWVRPSRTNAVGYRILDGAGRAVSQGRLSATEPIDVHGMAPGLYVMQLFLPDGAPRHHAFLIAR
ncbi:MAG TPA: T9SS type A sorting domain-containing protein [Flavobacteriales bacterium]